MLLLLQVTCSNLALYWRKRLLQYTGSFSYLSVSPAPQMLCIFPLNDVFYSGDVGRLPSQCHTLVPNGRSKGRSGEVYIFWGGNEISCTMHHRSHPQCAGFQVLHILLNTFTFPGRRDQSVTRTSKCIFHSFKKTFISKPW